MAYDRINWENTPSHVTPLSAENLNTMDEAIDSIDEELNRVGVKAVNLEARMDTAESNITSIGEELTEQDTYAKGMGTKTLQHETDIATLQGQVTTIISGATPAGNEVTDIRTAENGTTYDTAGNAVRAQIRQMIEVQDTQPTDPGNKLWINDGSYDSEDRQVPTWEEFSELKAELNDNVSDLKSAINGGLIYNYIENKNIDSNGAVVDAPGKCVSEKIPYTWTGDTKYYCGDTDIAYRIDFYDANDNHLGGFRNPATAGGTDLYRSINAETKITGTVAYVRFSFKLGYSAKACAPTSTELPVYWSAHSVQIDGILGDIEKLQQDVAVLQETAPEVGELENIEETLSSCVTFEKWAAMTLNIINGKVRDNTTFAEKTFSGFSTALVPVTAGEKYKITFWTNSNNYAPAWWSNSALIEVIPQASVEGGTIVTAPTGATQLILNGRNGVADISAYSNNQSSESKAFFAEIGQLKPKMGVAVTSTEVQVYQHGLVSGYDIMTLYKHKAMNNLLDINGWYKVPNNSNEVYVANSPYTRIAILTGSTDFIQPFMIWAVNNGNGDFTDPTVRKFTGGWHGYNSKTSGDYTATARTTSIKVTCDGREVNTDEADTGDTVILEITNRIQASNTEKQDGTGREVLEVKYIITYHSGYKRIDIACTLKALEEININRMYGIALYRSDMADECRAIGSRNHREAFTFADSINFDEYTNGIIVHCANGDIEMGLDPLIDLGSGYANENGKGATCGSSKAYMVMIYDNTFTATNGFNMKTGDEARWLGYYKVM